MWSDASPFEWFTVAECVAAAVDARADEGNSQQEMDAKYNAEFILAACDMKTAYDVLLQSLRDDPAALAKLDLTQTSWNRYRDAHIDERFPHQNESMFYGSIFPVCVAIELRSLAIVRKDELLQLNKCAGGLHADEAARTADAELSRAYREVLSIYRKDAAFVAAFRDAERTWLSYRDAQLDLVRVRAGDAGSACVQNELWRLTKQRAEEVKRWIAPPLEGDACPGSFDRNMWWLDAGE